MSRTTFTIAMALTALLLTQRQAAALDDAQIASDIEALSDPDGSVRERATTELWTAGKVAEPALRSVLQTGDPEAVRRAQAILARLELGVYPDTPPIILDLIAEYRTSRPAERARVVSRLADQGNRGLRVLMGLRRQERDSAVRNVMVTFIGAKPHEREGAALMIAYGDFAEASAVLKANSLGTKLSARDWAALLLVRGEL